MTTGATEHTANRPSLLVVEHHAGTANALARTLEYLGYEVTVAPTAATALAVAQRRRFALLICSVTLPDGDGAGLLIRLRSDYGLRGIAYSEDGDGTVRDEALAAGFEEVLVKPFTVDRLLQSVRHALAMGSGPAGGKI